MPTDLSQERLDFKVAVLALDQGCIVGADCDGDVQAHHVITQQQLRVRGLADHLWDPANGAAVCERHHRRHHNRREPIAIANLPKRCIDFAAENNLWDLVGRYYWRPPEPV